MDGVEAEAIYHADGTGELRAWGETFTREWRVEDGERVCFLIERSWQCFALERSSENPNRFRGTNLATGGTVDFEISGSELAIGRTPAKSQGGAAAPSADELAKELSNPNSSLSNFTFKFQYTGFKGDLPDADKQGQGLLLINPVLPFPREDGSKVIFRPAIPVLFDAPAYQGGNDWDGETALGDIGFDLAYAFKPNPDNPGGLRGVGLFASLPTGGDDLGLGETTALGPSLLLGQVSETSMWLLFPAHVWDVGGDIDVSRTTLTASYLRFGSGGWVYGTAPIITYNFEADDGDELTLPLNFTVSKTAVINGRPWKFAVELNWYVEQPDPFGPDFMIGFNVTPVVKNFMASWFN
jgi:hypothetical protein